jgi:hypothetical protein
MIYERLGQTTSTAFWLSFLGTGSLLEKERNQAIPVVPRKGAQIPNPATVPGFLFLKNRKWCCVLIRNRAIRAPVGNGIFLAVIAKANDALTLPVVPRQNFVLP